VTTVTAPAPSPSAIRGRAIGAYARRVATRANAIARAGAASALGVVGLASIAVGAGMVYRPAGFIVGGALAVWLASLMPSGGAK